MRPKLFEFPSGTTIDCSEIWSVSSIEEAEMYFYILVTAKRPNEWTNFVLSRFSPNNAADRSAARKIAAEIRHRLIITWGEDDDNDVPY